MKFIQMHMCFIWAASWRNQQNDFCAQQRLWSAWASAHSDQSLRCPHEETLGPQLPIECTAKTLIRVFAEHTDYFVSFVMRRLIFSAYSFTVVLFASLKIAVKFWILEEKINWLFMIIQFVLFPHPFEFF